jgi:predicted ATPase with chaperone activity
MGELDGRVALVTGAGKSMMARRLTTILPAMTLPKALETTRIHRVAGLTGDRTAVVTTRPCCASHHTISAVGSIGEAGAAARQGVASPPWGPLSRRTAGVPPPRPGGLAPAARGECHMNTISRASWTSPR